MIATYDRPAALERCLRQLETQVTDRRVEIIVVDNHPSSGQTPPVVAKFPGVILVSEPRKGLVYARNAGFVACTTEIAVTTDDDVVTLPNWLEMLVAPFARADVMAVTGNVLPMSLDARPQYYFEVYGGLSRGFHAFEVDGAWFERQRWRHVQTWTIGVTANAAFRTTVFSNPAIGLMDEALGPGMPSGVGEDTYLFYQILKAGGTIRYQPSAYVLHEHRATMRAAAEGLRIQQGPRCLPPHDALP